MTFIELVVVLGIFGAISATVLFNYRDFSTSITLQNLAQDIALQIKQAQTDAVSGRIPVFTAGSSQDNNPALIPADWKPSFGVAFQLNNANGWTLGGKGFAYYFNKGAPLPNNPQIDRDFYDMTQASYGTCGPLAAAESECLQEIHISSGDAVDLLCFDFVSVDDTCSSGNSSFNQAFISFTRPRGNAVIMDGAVDAGGASPHFNLYMRVTSATGGHKYISIWESGYISVN